LEECAKVAANYTVARQRERIWEAELTDRLRRAAGLLYDPISNLHVDHIRSGQSGEWRNVLSRDQVAMIEARADRWLAANGYAVSLPPGNGHC
jgi:hypothetical protein